MTKSRDRHGEARRNRYPALKAFARGYLHEDYLQEHGSAKAAALAFCADASLEERRQVKRELLAVSGEAQLPYHDAVKFFTHELKSAWQPASPAELEELLKILRNCG